MIELIIPALILGGFALISSTGLYIVSKKFYVYEDPRIEKVHELLPGVNCGGCGFPGCMAFAENLVTTKSLEKICPVAESEKMEAIAKLLDLKIEAGKKLIASLMCNGTTGNCKTIMNYRGIQDCWSMMIVADSNKACAYTCLGLGSCIKACYFDAMRIEDGIVVIDDEKCVGCGNCIPQCPKNLLHFRPVSKTVTVCCSNTDKGADAKKVCSVACINCMKCEKVCEYDAVHVTDFLAKIDYDKCTLCEKCVEACPTNAIEIRGIQTHG